MVANALIVISNFSATITTTTTAITTNIDTTNNNITNTETITNQVTGNPGTPSPKPGTPSNPSGDLTVLTPVQPTLSQDYTPLPSFPTQFSSKHGIYFHKMTDVHFQSKGLKF